MSRRNKAAGWTMAAVLAAAALLLSLAMPMLVPDYKNTIRAVEYDRGAIASTAADEEIELYPWTAFREEDCRTLAELGDQDPEIREQLFLDADTVLTSLLLGGLLEKYDTDTVNAEMEQGILYDEAQGRLYARGLTVETWDGEAELSFAFSGQGMEYLNITLPREKEVTPEESGEIQRQLRERLETFRSEYFGYYGSGEYESMAEGADPAVPYDEASDPAAADTGGNGSGAVPEKVFEEFYDSMYTMENARIAGQEMGWSFVWMMDMAFQEFACDMIPYQGEILLVFSSESADAEMILIYSPAAGRISGFSLRF